MSHGYGLLYLFQYGTLLLNEIEFINKCDNYFITKFGKNLLQNISPSLLWNSSFSLQMQQLLQNVTSLLQNATVIIRVLENALVQAIKLKIGTYMKILKIETNKKSVKKVLV